MDVTVRCHGSISAESSGAITCRLQATALRTNTAVDTATALGVLLFNDVSDTLCEALRALQRDGCQRVLAVAMHGTPMPSELAWKLLRHGASELVVWDRVPDAMSQIEARLQRWSAVEEILQRPLIRTHLVGRSTAWLAVLRNVIEVATFSEASVLVTGESGTGKELIARLIHTLDTRATKADLVVLDCSTLVPELSGSEFFGHERGAFTGAALSRDGGFAMAKGGTLFLDEVGELPPTLQAQLLRVVQERSYKPVGSNTWKHSDFRLIAATNRDLAADVEQGRFRADLYYRLATWVFRLPSVSERPEDILPLARHFLHELLPDTETPDFDQPVREYIQSRTYRGNVRELRQLISRIGQRHVGNGPISVGDLPEDDRPIPAATSDNWQDQALTHVVRRALAQGAGLRDIGQAATDAAIHVAVSEEGGNLQRAARRLGVTDRALQLRRAHPRLA
jgi:transcriptional regulator with GAF, ATPase, and Fis domain